MAKILVAEDRAAIRAKLQEALQRSGHTVETARNGVEALDRYIAGRPDLVILDLFMPKMNGFDALLHLRRLFPEARVIALAGINSIGQDALEVAVQLGADRAVPKTPDPHHLLDTVEELLAA